MPLENQRSLWDAFFEGLPASRDEDVAWREFRSVHGFDPEQFAESPPWCEAGANNNPWAKSAFLGDARRERAWANLGYLDHPFHFAYLWLDMAAFNGLTGKSLPYAERHSRAEMRREARRLARIVEHLNRELCKWPFRDELNLSKLVRASDYGSSVTLPGAPPFTTEQWQLGASVMFAGARQELMLPGAGQHSVLARMAETLWAWEPPSTLIERPGLRDSCSRFAVRWLDRSLDSLGGSMPRTARYSLIAELVQSLSELGKWGDDTWSEEKVRRSLDGKSSSVHQDSD